ncbi:hypothetical protein FHP29_11670 [Nocardioides albidus]|uniref:Uncharacterized protein n=1 Tax=Nocardioides albidus TaxID=1517589 RepID=A0A5C4VUP3_9ACTN|nr:hypothetical protein [Nocardioides albidus]TNM39538.1 hypothetical protein FHP29_11670 [Nocardioides albidus]
MTDPELTYQALVSGNPSGLRGDAETLMSVSAKLNDARTGIETAAGVPVWVGGAANAYTMRASSLVYGVSVVREAVVRAQGALLTAEAAYLDLESQAITIIGKWRQRDTAMPALLTQLYAYLVQGALLAVGRSYNRQLAAIAAALKGEPVDTSELDEETRAWVEKGAARTEGWAGGGLGPMIPNIAANGDDRGLIPQGLGYDPETRSLLQTYYPEAGGDSVLSVVDEVTGNEQTEVKLGGFGEEVDKPNHHAGGVAVDGDSVYVTDNGKVFEYSLKDIQAAVPGTTVQQTRPPTFVDAHSYSAVHDGTLYVGDHYQNVMYAYQKDATGTWQQVRAPDGAPLTIPTPDRVQGVLVRDGEFVFSTSFGRTNESAVVVQDRDTGERSDEYPFPNMAEGIVEVDGQVYVTYESGAAKYDHVNSKTPWWPFDEEDNPDDLWAMRYLTATPLGELGLESEVEVEPATLRSASSDLDDAAFVVNKQHTEISDVDVAATDFGMVPAAAALAKAIDTLVTEAAAQLKLGGLAVADLADGLWNSGKDYDVTDLAVQAAFDSLRSTA